MSNLRPKIREALNTFLEAQEGHHLRADVLRVIEEEALLLKWTELVKDEFSKDPMEQLGEISKQVERLMQMMRVTSYHNVRALDGYTRIDAVVTLGTSPPNLLQLTFRYERKRREEGPGCHIRYSIELSKNYLQRENLIVVEVWAPQNGPSPGTAVCINQSMAQLMNGDGENCDDDDDDENGWEDIDEDDDKDGEAMGVEVNASAKSSQAPKRQRLSEDLKEATKQNGKNGANADSQQQQKQDDDDKSQQTHDEFIAYLDPDAMHDFLVGAGLNTAPMDDGKAFFLLTTFPFYEHDFDLVGFLLEEMFGFDDDEDDG